MEKAIMNIIREGDFVYLGEENISNDMKAEKIFIVKQESNFGEEICLEM